MLLKLTSNALVTLVLTEQDCFRELFEIVNVAHWISEFIWQRDSRSSDQEVLVRANNGTS